MGVADWLEKKISEKLGKNFSILNFIGRSAENRMVIWGTDVVVEESREKFMKFIKQYICQEFDDQGKILENKNFLICLCSPQIDKTIFLLCIQYFINK